MERREKSIEKKGKGGSRRRGGRGEEMGREGVRGAGKRGRGSRISSM